MIDCLHLPPACLPVSAPLHSLYAGGRLGEGQRETLLGRDFHEQHVGATAAKAYYMTQNPPRQDMLLVWVATNFGPMGSYTFCNRTSVNSSPHGLIS